MAGEREELSAAVRGAIDSLLGELAAKLKLTNPK